MAPIDAICCDVEGLPFGRPRAEVHHGDKAGSTRADFERRTAVVGIGEPAALPLIAANRSLQDLQELFHDAPYNSGIGYELYRAQMHTGRVDDALLTARHFSEWPNCPAYFHFLEAQCWAEKQHWERAWNAWQEFQAAEVRASK